MLNQLCSKDLPSGRFTMRLCDPRAARSQERRKKDKQHSAGAFKYRELCDWRLERHTLINDISLCSSCHMQNAQVNQG